MMMMIMMKMMMNKMWQLNLTEIVPMHSLGEELHLYQSSPLHYIRMIGKED